MQLGLTIPLQKFLKVHRPPYGTSCDLFYCWELWKDYNALFMDGLRQGMLLEGFTQQEIEAYTKVAGKIEITKTHGRRSVSGLNQMDNYLWSIPVKVRADELFQSVHCYEVNRERCKMAGYRRIL